MPVSNRIPNTNSYPRASAFSGSGTIGKTDDVILVDRSQSNVVINLGSIFFNKYLTIKVTDKADFSVRVTGLNGNFEEDDNFTSQAQTISSPASGNTLTADLDVDNDIFKGDTIMINDIDVFTVASVAGKIITTNETITNAYTADTLAVAGLFIGNDPKMESIILFSDKTNGIWRTISI